MSIFRKLFIRSQYRLKLIALSFPLRSPGGYSIMGERGRRMDTLEPDDLNLNDGHDDCCCMNSERKSNRSDQTKKNLVNRLNRIEGQIRGVKGLIEKDTYCDDVITQIAAIQAALNGVSKLLLEGHLKNCVLERIQAGDLKVLDEFLVTIQRTMKK